MYVEQTIDVAIDVTSDEVQIQAGGSGSMFSYSSLVSLANGNGDQQQFLLCQMALRLISLGVDLSDAGAVKQALEGGTYQIPE